MDATFPSATIGAYEAKAKFSSILSRVANGETITVTRRGSNVAKIVPAATGRAFDWDGFEALRREIIGQNRGKGRFDFKKCLKQGRK
jgi:prevent-host-death family protein